MSAAAVASSRLLAALGAAPAASPRRPRARGSKREGGKALDGRRGSTSSAAEPRRRRSSTTRCSRTRTEPRRSWSCGTPRRAPSAACPIEIDVRGAGGQERLQEQRARASRTSLVGRSVLCAGQASSPGSTTRSSATAASRLGQGPSRGRPRARRGRARRDRHRSQARWWATPCPASRRPGTCPTARAWSSGAWSSTASPARAARSSPPGGGDRAAQAPASGADYHIFFIGDPRGAELTVEAPPTVLE